VQLRPGEVDVSIDGCFVVITLASDGGSFEVALEPAAACQVGLQLIDQAMRACRGARDAALKTGL
jgi:hypothetical protein